MTGLGIFNSIGSILDGSGGSVVDNILGTIMPGTAGIKSVINVASNLGSQLGIFAGQSVTPQVQAIGNQPALVVPVNTSGLGINSNLKTTSSVGSLAGQPVSLNASGKAVAIGGGVSSVQTSAQTSNASGKSDNTVLWIAGGLAVAKALRWI